MGSDSGFDHRFGLDSFTAWQGHPFCKCSVSPLKIGRIPKGSFIFQLLIFQGYASFREGIWRKDTWHTACCSLHVAAGLSMPKKNPLPQEKIRVYLWGPFYLENKLNISCLSMCVPFLKLKPYLGVSKNRDTPKSSILIGFCIINHPSWWVFPLFLETSISGDTENTMQLNNSSATQPISRSRPRPKVPSAKVSGTWIWT